MTAINRIRAIKLKPPSDEPWELDVPFRFATSAILELAERLDKLEAVPRIDEHAVRTEAQTNPQLIKGWVNLYVFQELDRRRHNFDGASARFEGGVHRQKSDADASAANAKLELGLKRLACLYIYAVAGQGLDSENDG